MLDLNNVPPMEGGNGDFELMPDGTVVSGIIKLLGGDIELPEYGGGNYFKASKATSAKWLPIELTIVGGGFDKRKVWATSYSDTIDEDSVILGQSRLWVSICLADIFIVRHAIW